MTSCWRQRLALLVASGVLLLASALALQQSIGHLFARGVLENLPEEVDTRGAEFRWDLARVRLEQAVALSDGHARHLETLGRYWRRRGDALLTANPPAAWRAYEEALDAYGRALSARPGWPAVRIRMALVKARLYQFDETFSDLLREAHAIGPREPGVQMGIVTLVLDHWPLLPVGLRDFGLDRVVDGLGHSNPAQRQAMEQVVARRGMWPLLCERVATSQAEWFLEHCPGVGPGSGASS